MVRQKLFQRCCGLLVAPLPSGAIVLLGRRPITRFVRPEALDGVLEDRVRAVFVVSHGLTSASKRGGSYYAIAGGPSSIVRERRYRSARWRPAGLSASKD